MKYILSILLFFLLVAPLAAQNDQDRVIFKAMQDEMQRNKEQLVLPGMQKPYYLSYTLGRYRSFEVRASLGGIVNAYETPWNSQGAVQMFLGNDDHNSDFIYGFAAAQLPMPANVDYDVMRRNYWMGSDIMYKWSLQAANAKESYLKANPRKPEEADLKDRQRVEPVTRIENAKNAYSVDLPALENVAKELSAMFKEYKDIFNSSVVINGSDIEIYKMTTDGVVLKEPMRYTNLYASAYVVTEDGIRIDDTYSVLVACPGDLPSMEDLKKGVKAFAENLIKLKNAPVITEYYGGPVLFEGGACSTVFMSNLLKKGALFAYRKPDTDQVQAMKTLNDRMGMKIVDSRLTIKNYSSLDKYNGTSLLGAYTIDAEGVVPPKEVTLVENGIFKGMLNGNVPAVKAPESTGSLRFSLSSRNGAFNLAPGTIHIKADKGTKPEKMKSALIKAAKEEGLKYAYIVRSLAGKASRIYRVDLKDGSETQVRFGDVTGFTLPNLKRMLGISSKENVSNYIFNGEVLSSMIYPSSILVENIEINKSDVKKDKEQVLTFPLQK
ncbi:MULTISPECIES: metallopeptidase TldD-related protein [Butyricimonas]|uniref:metallopeptidase TldD-related protein n=1 Tax=Butyricimonas TaxID=574697 RepID=UPI0007FB55E2|nr:MULTISPECIES: metallopeptidase TldD-related protein [Butyricimonas]